MFPCFCSRAGLWRLDAMTTDPANGRQLLIAQRWSCHHHIARNHTKLITGNPTAIAVVLVNLHPEPT